MNSRPKAALMDFDGVIADTEPLYDVFWGNVGNAYHKGEHFAAKIKGTTLPNIMLTYFAENSEEERQEILRNCADYEKIMPYPPMAGSREFIEMLKAHGVKVALVTSSDDAKVERALTELNMQHTFDAIVSADRIAHGKPDPMCYQLAAQDLGLAPSECIVFEDSFNGIKAGNAAGMRVVALSTTNSAESLAPFAWKVLPDLKEITFEEYATW